MCGKQSGSMISLCNILLLTMPLQQFRNLVQAATWKKKNPNDWELLGMFGNGQYYFDKVLPFGLRSAPYIFNQLLDAIEWILLNKCSISFVCHILDDFFIVEPPCHTPPLDSLCQASLSSMILTFKNLNIPISAAKTEGPSQII